MIALLSFGNIHPGCNQLCVNVFNFIGIGPRGRAAHNEPNCRDKKKFCVPILSCLSVDFPLVNEYW